jgi:hypothetical protein
VSGVLGVPESSPVLTAKAAQVGLFWMLKLTGSSVALRATVGRNR